jgi:small subunit ribosomal protein S19
MLRSKFKIKYFDKLVINNYLDNSENNKFLKLKKRNTIIHPSLVDKKIYIHNGRKFYPLIIIKYMIGFKIGELRKTRYLTEHVSKNIKG